MICRFHSCREHSSWTNAAMLGGMQKACFLILATCADKLSRCSATCSVTSRMFTWNGSQPSALCVARACSLKLNCKGIWCLGTMHGRDIWMQAFYDRWSCSVLQPLRHVSCTVVLVRVRVHHKYCDKIQWEKSVIIFSMQAYMALFFCFSFVRRAFI